MSDINREDIKLFSSQRLDDTTQGGGSMTLTEIIDGEVNNLFPDISRLDRVYGRVSMRKAFLSVQTSGRPTYYGSHVVLTQQASDPRVGVSFFTTENWVDVRSEARTRIEGYLVKGGIFGMSLYSDHYTGTKVLNCFTTVTGPVPQIGDVLALVANETIDGTDINPLTQFVRVTDVTTSLELFVVSNTNVQKKMITMTIGSTLNFDLPGIDITINTTYLTDPTTIHSTVVADSARYYGILPLAEDATSGSFTIRASSTKVPIVPSSQSQTAIADSGVGCITSPVIQKDTSANSKISKTVLINTNTSPTMLLGTPVLPKTFILGTSLVTDDGIGTLNHSSLGEVGSISYATGTITWGENWCSISTNHTVSFTPAVSPSRISQSGKIYVSTNNRGFVYIFSCTPKPEPFTMRVDYLNSGKWYSLFDNGIGVLKGVDDSIGVGSINYVSGSVSLTLGGLPDTDSDILLFWSESTTYTSFSGQTKKFKYVFGLEHTHIYPTSFTMSWTQTGLSERIITSDSDGNLKLSGSTVGSINYATGYVSITNLTVTPPATQIFTITYIYGEPEEITYVSPPRDINGDLKLTIPDGILPGSISVSWPTLILDYPIQSSASVVSRAPIAETVYMTFSGGGNAGTWRDPIFTFSDYYDEDDSTELGYAVGRFIDEHPTHNGITGMEPALIRYDNYLDDEDVPRNAYIKFRPDFLISYPVPQFGWRNEGESYSDSIGNVIQPEIRVITGVTYVPTSAIFQPEATVTITYRTSLGDNNVSFTTTLDKKYSFDPEYASMMLPNSGVFSITSPTGVVLLEQQGSVYTDINLITGSKTKVGTIDYDQKEITITTDHSSFVSTTSGVSLYCKSAMTYVGDDACSTIVFRTPGSPVTSGSLSVSATCTDGTLLTGTSDFDGVISGTGITGDIRFITGIVNLQFGTYVTDNASAQSQSWYNANNVVGSNVWKPYFVVASTIMVSCVVESYIPLDSDLLGLDPVRLPLDGKVPIFRDGNIVLIHNTLSTTIPDNPALAGETYSTGRTNLSLIELYDQNSVYIPDTNYTVDLDAGTVTMNSPLNLSTVSYTPTQPLVIMHRIEDMLLASDVQLTGYMAFTSPLTHNYSASNSYVSTVLPIGDLQSGVYNEFEQDSWTEVWSDELIGSEPIASYDLINFPIIVENDSATQERFALIFQNTTNVMVVGESLGVLSDGSSTTWSIGSNIAPINPITGNAYFTILAEGWGAGWSTGNVFRFNTRAANFPIWFIRTTLQGPAVGSSDSYSCQIRGDSS